MQLSFPVRKNCKLDSKTILKKKWLHEEKIFAKIFSGDGL